MRAESIRAGLIAGGVTLILFNILTISILIFAHALEPFLACAVYDVGVLVIAGVMWILDRKEARRTR